MSIVISNHRNTPGVTYTDPPEALKLLDRKPHKSYSAARAAERNAEVYTHAAPPDPVSREPPVINHPSTMQPQAMMQHPLMMQNPLMMQTMFGNNVISQRRQNGNQLPCNNSVLTRDPNRALTSTMQLSNKGVDELRSSR